jgi:hypothetical protein
LLNVLESSELEVSKKTTASVGECQRKPEKEPLVERI